MTLFKVSDIIKELVDDDKSLNSTLAKTKVLADELNLTELEIWVSKEFNGYSASDVLPSYRTCMGQLRGIYRTHRLHQFHDEAIQSSFVPEDYAISLETFRLLQSIKSVEAMAKGISHNPMRIDYNGEVIAFFSACVQKKNYPFFEMRNLYLSVSPHVIIDCLSTIRFKLLEFYGRFKKEIGDEIEPDSIKSDSSTLILIYQNMQSTIINNNGDGNNNVINSGENSTINTSNQVIKGDFASLEKILKENEVSEADIVELKSAIATDQNANGKNVTKWISKMLGKAADGAWKFATDKAYPFLFEAIKAFFQ